MPKKFISNLELRQLLLEATEEERLALTKIMHKNQEAPFGSQKLQEEISLFGGHGVGNWFRGSGTGYLDIVDDVAETLEITGIESYSATVKYFDEIYYIKGEKDDTPDSKIERKYTRDEASRLGNDYAEKVEGKIIIKVMENAYQHMKDRKEKTEKELFSLLMEEEQDKAGLDGRELNLLDVEVELESSRALLLLTQDPESDSHVDLNHKITGLEAKQVALNKEIKLLTSNIIALPQKIKNKETEVDVAIDQLKNFNTHLSQTVRQFDSSSLGAITGTAGLVALANAGGFATYTFLTSMMSTLSFGTLGFGAYTAATSFLSVVIGPVGWAGLGLWTIFTLGKPDASKLVLLVATIGAIRQRVLYTASEVALKKSNP